MTHPTLGYANLRFASDDIVHLPATPAATMTTACLASGPGEEPLPHDIDAQVTCPQCLTAVEADWWMALMENERRTGEVTSLTGTLSEVKTSVARVLSQAEAVAKETLLGGGASMIERAYLSGRPTEMLGVLSMPQGDWSRGPIPPALAGSAQTPEVQQAFRQALADTVLDVHLDVSSDYLFAQDKVSFRARRGDAKAYEHVENPITPEKLDDVVESLAQQLANQRSPLVPRHEPKIARPGSFTGDVPLADPGAERVRRMMDAGVQKMNALPKGSTLSEQVRAAADAADEFLAEHPFDERCHRCNYDTHRCPGCGEPLPHGTEVCADCNVRLAYEAEFTHGGEVVDRSEYDYPDRNWCHVHNREAQAGREQCSECDGEQGEDRKAGES